MQEKILLAFLTGLVGLACGYVLEKIRARREPRRELSWVPIVERASLAVQAGIQEKVTVLYGGTVVDELVLLTFQVANTGNRVIKDTRFRFTFAPNTQILESYNDPIPAEELGFLVNNNTDEHERRYVVTHLERNQSVRFQFVLTGTDIESWRFTPSNTEGDVNYVRRDSVPSREDQEHIRPFLLTLAFLGLALPLVRLLPGTDKGNSSLYSGAIFLIFALFMAPHLMPVARLIERIVARLLATPEEAMRPVTVSGRTGSNVVVLAGSRLTGDLTVHPRPRSDGEDASSASHEAPRNAEHEQGGELLDLKVGDVVDHETFGRGAVTATREEGNKAQVRVAFADPVGEKWLMLRYAPIRKVDKP